MATLCPALSAFTQFNRPASETYCARLSSEEAETRRCSLRREPIAAVMGAPLLPGLPGAVPPVRMLDGFTCTLAVLGAWPPAAFEEGPLLFSMCVKMSLVYLRRLVISWLLESSAWLRGMMERSPFLLT